MVSKVTKNGTQLVQKTHKLWSKQCKKRTNYGQNNAKNAPLRYCYAVISTSFSLGFNHEKRLKSISNFGKKYLIFVPKIIQILVKNQLKIVAKFTTIL